MIEKKSVLTFLQPPFSHTFPIGISWLEVAFCVSSNLAESSKLLAIVGLILVNVAFSKSGLDRRIIDSKLSRGFWVTLLSWVVGSSILFASPILPVMCSGSSGFTFEHFPLVHPGIFRNSVKSVVFLSQKKNDCRYCFHIQTLCNNHVFYIVFIEPYK